MYNGIININNLDNDEILELLEACDELCFDELTEDLQNFLIKEEKEWIQENLIDIYKISSKHQSFNLLQDHCEILLYDNPELWLKSCDIAIIEKSMFISILKKDDLELREIDIWDCVIKWGIGQNEELAKDISEWRKEDFVKLKNIIKDFIPLVEIT